MASESGNSNEPSPATSGTPASTFWYSLAADAPEIAGAELVTTGPAAVPNGLDDSNRFHRSWAYSGTVLSVKVDINRAGSSDIAQENLKWGASVSQQAGHTVASLSGIGDSCIAILPRNYKGVQRPAVRVEATSGNATISILMQVDGVIDDESGLIARSGEFATVLNQVIDDLRPR
jgi:hypothetical protein